MSVDYTQAGWLIKAKKLLRYIALYGLSRTFAKARGQYHMKATETFKSGRWLNRSCVDPNGASRSIALIGCGNYAFSTIAYYLKKNNSRFLCAAYDRQPSRALSLCKAYGGAYAVADWREILADPQVQLVFIATNHATHAEYAMACINAGKHVHIEKPHVVSAEQLDQLLNAMKQHPKAKVFLGFNRPRSYLFRRLQHFLARETGPLMINWFIAGHTIEDTHWYFDEKEGGRVLGNLFHWTDLTLHLVSVGNAFPCTIIPATPSSAKSDFMVAILFAEGSCAAITFSAKGQTFEGVREMLNLQKGDVLANITDFGSLSVDVGEKKIEIRPWFRDHGHGKNIIHSVEGALDNGIPGEDIAYIAATARFVLAVKQAIDSQAPVTLSREEALGRGA